MVVGEEEQLKDRISYHGAGAVAKFGTAVEILVRKRSWLARFAYSWGARLPPQRRHGESTAAPTGRAGQEPGWPPTGAQEAASGLGAVF